MKENIRYTNGYQNKREYVSRNKKMKELSKRKKSETGKKMEKMIKQEKKRVDEGETKQREIIKLTESEKQGRFVL